jgi:hypothetical protein
MTAESEKTSEFIPKKVDESWKDSVRKEKEISGEKPSEPALESDFLTFLSTLAMQALMALGEAANPVTGETLTDLPQAQYLIDVIQMLSDKTQGNLSAQESAEVKTVLYQLRLKFVKKSQQPKP